MGAVDDVRELDDEGGAPAVVGIAATIGFTKAIFELGFGLFGALLANSMGESFGAATIVFGALYAIASLLLLRGNRVGFYATVILSVLGLVAGVVYLFRAEDAILFGTLLAGALNALVLYLLLATKSAREYFAG